MKARWSLVVLGCLLLASALRADEARKAVATTYQVPYRLTDTKHVLVRAKINGKGPFNFLLDTGAPALFVGTAVCRKLGVEPDKDGWGTFERFEIEGGVVVKKARGRVEDPFQLEGMNGLGLAGVHLDGMIGYNVLARYRLEFDFTKDKMGWTPLNYEPPLPPGLRGKGGAPAGLDAMGAVLKLMGVLLGKKPAPDVVSRGFLGMELADTAAGVEVKAVLAKGPAATAGLKPGDHISRFQGRDVHSSADLQRLAAKVVAGAEVRMTVKSGADSREVAVKTGEGL